MTDEQENPFPWGLTPGGGDEPPPTQPPPLEPPPTQPQRIEPPPSEPPRLELPPTEPSHLQPPTEAFPPVDPAIEGVIEAIPEPLGISDPVDEAVEPSALDSLFGESAFVEYEDAAIIPPPRNGTRDQASAPGQELVVVPVGPRPPRAPIPKIQKILMAVAGGLAAVLAIIALYVLGTRIAQVAPPPAVASSSPSPTPSVSGGPVVIGPVPPGEYRWDQLAGGECLQPFENAWQDTYLVVPCAQPHAAQLVKRGTLEDPASAEYPPAAELLDRIQPVCTAANVIDYAVAGTVLDLQVTASYPVDASDWADGNREYFCFVQRASGEPLAASVVISPVPVAP